MQYFFLVLEMGLEEKEKEEERKRAEKDLKDIKELYYKRNSVHLEDEVSKETSGDYKKFLLTLLGK